MGNLNGKKKKCSRCGVEHPLHFFRRTGRKVTHGLVRNQHTMNICKACEGKERLEKKYNDPDYPFDTKARGSIFSHAKKRGLTSPQFCDNFDVSVSYIAMLFKREWNLHYIGFPCVNCEHPLKDDLSDFTLDVIDPSRPPTRSNLRIICKTCNVEKGKKDPTKYDFEAREYRHNIDSIKQGVQIDFPVRVPVTASKTDPQFKLF